MYADSFLIAPKCPVFFWNQNWLDWLLFCQCLERPGRIKPLLDLLNLPLGGLSSRAAGFKMGYGDGNILKYPILNIETLWVWHGARKKSYPQCSQKTSMRLSTSMSGCGDPVFRDWTKAIPLSTDPQLHWRRAISQNPERNTQGIAWLEKQRSHTFSISTAPRKIWAHGIIIIYFMTHTGAQCLDEIHQSWNIFAQDRCCKWTAYWIPN